MIPVVTPPGRRSLSSLRQTKKSSESTVDRIDAPEKAKTEDVVKRLRSTKLPGNNGPSSEVRNREVATVAANKSRGNESRILTSREADRQENKLKSSGIESNSEAENQASLPQAKHSRQETRRESANGIKQPDEKQLVSSKRTALKRRPDQASKQPTLTDSGRTSCTEHVKGISRPPFIVTTMMKDLDPDTSSVGSSTVNSNVSQENHLHGDHLPHASDAGEVTVESKEELELNQRSFSPAQISETRDLSAAPAPSVESARNEALKVPSGIQKATIAVASGYCESCTILKHERDRAVVRAADLSVQLARSRSEIARLWKELSRYKHESATQPIENANEIAVQAADKNREAAIPSGKKSSNSTAVIDVTNIREEEIEKTTEGSSQVDHNVKVDRIGRTAEQSTRSRVIVDMAAAKMLGLDKSVSMSRLLSDRLPPTPCPLSPRRTLPRTGAERRNATLSRLRERHARAAGASLSTGSVSGSFDDSAGDNMSVSSSSSRVQGADGTEGPSSSSTARFKGWLDRHRVKSSVVPATGLPCLESSSASSEEPNV
jgi:hypothetical protein